MLTEKELKMYHSQDRQIKVTDIDGGVFTGRCTEFTSALDNVPEEASITLSSPITKDGERFPGLLELLAHEIERIEYL